MGIWFYKITNAGDNLAQFSYSYNGSKSVDLRVGESSVPDWCIGYREDPLRVTTNGDKTLKWMICDGGSWELHVSVSSDGGYFYQDLAAIKILQNYGRFNIWACNNSIVIENEDNKLGRITDGKTFRFFVATEEGITPSTDPECMIDYLLD